MECLSRLTRTGFRAWVLLEPLNHWFADRLCTTWAVSHLTTQRLGPIDMNFFDGFVE